MLPAPEPSEGGPFERGCAAGSTARRAIRHNVTAFWKNAAVFGIRRSPTLGKAEPGMFDEDALEYMKGLARGSGTSFQDIIAYNSLNHNLAPDECTVLIAMGDSTTTGSVVVMKNSDKVGSEKFVGSNFYRNKEINILVFEKPDNGNRFVAVAAAGELSIKMGMNDKGVVTGSNISRTTELKNRKVAVGEVRALDRGWLMREGIIRRATALEATKFATERVAESPMYTPGNLEFVDAASAYVIEGSYDRLAVQKFLSGTIARSNRFQVLHELNDSDDVSSYVRYVRASQLLEQNKGNISSEKMMEFSQDHLNGPGLNSICRHDEDPKSETSLAAAVMEINGSDPKKSLFHVALGKPCRAWQNSEAHTTIRLDGATDEVPKAYYNGDVWKHFYIETP